MFKVIVLACLASSPQDCWEYTDTRGPYFTREQCVERAYVMGNSIMEIHDGDIKPQAFRCVQLKGQKL